MKAVVPKDGSARLVTGYDKPRRVHASCMVRIMAATVNPLDYKVAHGTVPIRANILGFDFAGEVVDPAGPWSAGDRVVGYAPSGGAFAEYISVPAMSLVRAPAQGSLQQAAALGVAGLTAYQLVCHGRLPQGARMLIQGASGGVGHLAVQIAKAKGLHVTATCSGGNADFVKSLGADQVVDYTCQDLVALFKDTPFDGVVDLVGGNAELQGLAVLKPRGYFAELFNNGWERVYPGRFRPMLAWALQTFKMKSLALMRMGPDYRVGFLRWDTHEAAALVGLVEGGKVAVHLAETVPLEGCGGAVEAVGRGHTRGKVAVRVVGA